MVKGPKGDEIRKRIKNNDSGVELKQLPPKHIYVKSLDRKIKFESK